MCFRLQFTLQTISKLIYYSAVNAHIRQCIPAIDYSVAKYILFVKVRLSVPLL